MKIAILGSRGYPYVYSGYETFVAELAPRLVKRGHSVVVYCHRGLFTARPAEVRGVRLSYIPSIEVKVLSQFSHSLLATLHVSLRTIDVVLYVNSANGPFGFIPRLFGKRTAINVDGMEWLRPKWKGLGSVYFKIASYLSTRLFDSVITDSEEMSRVYRELFHSPSEIIAYGAYAEFSADAKKIGVYGLTPGEYYLVVGRLIPDNNADLIVREFAQCQSRRKLVVVGDVPYRDRYAAKVKGTADSRIVFTGYVRDPDLLRELYCNCHAYIHGHEFGGTNPTLLKALGCGCRILALDTPFAREVLLSATHGLYFTKSPGSLVHALSVVESEAAPSISQRETARDRIRRHYDWERITDQYESLLRELAESRD